MPTPSPVLPCPDCGTPLLSVSPVGHCPQCLVRLSLLTEEEMPPTPPSSSTAPWTILEDYEIYEELGRGGMGIVYRGRHRRLARWVAVKVLRGGELADAKARRRFQAEAETVAQLQHPGIVTIHDVGEEQGVCWYSMELVPGRNLEELVRQQPLDAKAAALMVQDIAEAVAHAHQHGVLHRDLKPSNVILDAEGKPRVTDFGIARRGGEAAPTQTATGQMLGSPGYTAPEQGLQGLADARTDVYGLASILYHLLTGRPPFQGPTLDAILVQLRENEPVPPRRLNPTVPRDLETICLKGLARDPGKRYPSAQALANDLQLYLTQRPILARPVSLPEQAWRWMKRRPFIATLLAVILLVTVAAFILIDQARRQELSARQNESAAKILAETRSRELDQANQRSRDLLDTTDLERAEEWFRTSERDRGLEILGKILRRTPDHPVAGPRLASAFWHGGVAMPVLWPIIEKEEILKLFLLEQGKSILVCTCRGAVLRDAESGQEIRRFSIGDEYVSHFILSPDGSHFCAWHPNPNGKLFHWKVADAELVFPPLQHPGWVHVASFTPDGRFILTLGSEDEAHFWDAATGEESLPALQHPGPLFAGAMSVDGTLAATSMNGTIFLWELPTRKLRCMLPPFSATVGQLAFSEDNSLLAAGSFAGEVGVFATAKAAPALWKGRLGSEVSSLQFSPHATRLLTATKAKVTRLWKTQEGDFLGRVMSHEDEVRSAQFDPAAESFICTVSSDGTARLWDAHTGRALAQPLQHGERVNAAVFTPDHHTLYTAGASGVVERWNILPSVPRLWHLAHQKTVTSAVWSPDGKQVATTSDDQTTTVWNAQTGTAMVSNKHRSVPSFAIFHPHGDGLLVASEAAGARLKALTPGMPNRATYALEAGGRQKCGAYNSDGSRYAAGTVDGRFYVWDTRTPEAEKLLFAPILPHKPELSAITVQFSPDGKRLLTIAASGAEDEHPYEAKLRDAETGTVLGELNGHSDDIYGGSFSPDGALVATAGNDNTARVWNGQNGQATGQVFRHHASVRCVAFSPDGSLLATASTDHQCRLWSLKTGQLAAPIMLHQDQVHQVRFSPDGMRLLTACADGTVRLWAVATGLALTEELPSPGAVSNATFSPDGQRILVCSQDAAARIWDVPNFPPRPPDWLVDLTEMLTFADYENDQAKILQIVSRYQQTLNAIRDEPAASPWRSLAIRLLDRGTPDPKD